MDEDEIVDGQEEELDAEPEADDGYELGAEGELEEDTESDAYVVGTEDEASDEDLPLTHAPTASPTQTPQQTQYPVNNYTQNLRDPLQNIMGEDGAQVTDAYIRAVIQERLEQQSVVMSYVAADAARYPQWHQMYGASLAQMLAMLPPEAQANPRSVEDARMLIMRAQIEQNGDMNATMEHHLSLMNQHRQPQAKVPRQAPQRAQPPQERTPQSRAPVAKRPPQKAPTQVQQRASVASGGGGMIKDLMSMYGISQEEATRAFKARKSGF